MNPTEARWLSVDPMWEKYAGMSPYNYCAGNPVKLVDVDGRDCYIFNEDLTFNSVQSKNGHHYGYIKGKDITFNFADPVNDPELVNTSNFQGLIFHSDEEIDNALSISGAKDIHLSSYKYALDESNANNINGEGKLDFVITADMGLGYEGIPADYLYLTYSENVGYLAHNNYNFGNFLWGAAMNCLDIPLDEAVIAAHGNNYYNDPVSKGKLDSPDDQRSIRAGYKWVSDHSFGSSLRNIVDDNRFITGTKISEILWGK